MKIAVVGTGYVGLSNAILLSQHNDVVALDIVKEKVDLLNAKQSPIEDAEIQDFLDNKPLRFTATTDPQQAISGADFVILRPRPTTTSKPTTLTPEALKASSSPCWTSTRRPSW